MNIRPISPQELPQFAKLTDRPESVDSFSTMLQGMWDSGESKPDWCFIIRNDDGSAVGRIGFMQIDGRDDHLAILGWTLPWDGDYLTVGTQSMRDCLGALAAQGVNSIQRELHPHWVTVDAQHAVLSATGFTKMQRQCIYAYAPATTAAPPPSKRLTFRTLEEVGEDVFIDAMSRVSAATADRDIQQRIIELGSAEAFARAEFAFSKADHTVGTGWWQLAFDGQGALVGFLQPVQFTGYSDGNVAYVGVVPSQRGRGYSRDLLGRAINVLRDAGMTFINARTDADNSAIRRTNEKLGFVLESTITRMGIQLEND